MIPTSHPEVRTIVSREALSVLTLASLGVAALSIPPSRSPVGRITLLSVTFALASLSLLLGGATYLGLTYVIVYVGAISLLFVFTVMMIGGGLERV